MAAPLIQTDGRPALGPSEFARGPRGPNAIESDVGFLDAISGPAWRRQSVVNDIMTGDIAQPEFNLPEDRVDVWSEIEGTEYERFFADFAPLTTQAEIEEAMRRVDLEEADRRVIDEAGLGGFAAEAIATVLDVPSLIPGGVAFTGTRAGLGVLKVGARTGLAAGAEAAAVEIALHRGQITRTAEESAFAIGGSIVLGALMGSALSAVAGRTADGVTQFQQTSAAIQSAPDEFGRPGDLSAAARIQPEISDFDLPTAGAQALKNSTPAGLSFTDRFANSQSPVARKIGAELLGNEYAFAGQERLALQPAAEVFAGITEDKARIAIANVFKTDYNAYRKAARADGRAVLKSNEFADRVSAAMRRGDADPVYPEVTAAAEKLRREVVEPMKNEAIRLGLLPEGVTTRTATSYFTRMWDANRIVARSDVFLDRLSAEFSRGLKDGSIRQQDTAQRELSSLQNELFDLTDERLDAGDFDAQRITEFLSDEGDIQKRIAAIRRQTRGMPARPLTQLIRSLGGVEPQSRAAAELRSLGVEPRDAPGLFKKGGLRDLDNIEPVLIEDIADQIGRDRDFLSRQGVLDTVADEARGAPRRSPGDQALLDELDDLVELLDAGRRLVEEKGPQRRAMLKRAKELRAKIVKAQEAARAAAIKADFTAEEIDVFARAAAEDVMAQLTDPNVSPTDLLNVTIRTRGPLNARTLNVRDVDYEDFLINDAEFVLNRYARVMAAETELTRRFGRADMKDQIAEINADYGRIRDAATTEKQRTAIERERKRTIKALQAARDQVRGNYLAAERASGTFRAIQGMLTFNYVRALGDVLRSSLPDVFKVTMTNGFAPLVSDIMVPLMRGAGRLRVAQREIADAAGIAEVLLNNRMMRIADVTDPYAVRTPVESALNYMGSKASLFSGIMHWNQFLKETAGYLTTQRLRRMNLAKLSKRDERFLGRLKLTRANLERIQREMATHGNESGGVFMANSGAWDPDVARLFGAVVRADADTVIVTPGIGDKIPLAEEKWFLKPALQFKAFALASHRKTLIVGMQEDQARFLANAALMVSMGMFVYWLKAQSRQSGPSDNPGVWLAEGIDRSGLMPIYMEVNNMAERVGAPGVYYGLGSVFGETPERASRYQVRSVAGAAMGPTFGLLTDGLTVVNAGLTGDVGPGDVGSARRLIPFGNHPGIKEYLNLWAVPALKEMVE